MKKRSYKLIYFLLVLAMLMGAMSGCGANQNAASQETTIPPVPTHSCTTIPTESTAAPTTEPATEPTTAPTVEPTVTEPPIVTQPVLQPPEIQAAQAFIFDTRTRQFLYTSTPVDTALYPASITKLFTSYVAQLYLDLTDTITVGNELSLVAWDASVAGLEQGSVWTVEGLLYASLLPSGCDASYVLAVATGRELLEDPDASTEDALHAFMVQCNYLARKLGMENTNFVTPDGYHHEDHYISVMAFPIIAHCILSNEVLADMVKTPRITVSYTNASGKICMKQMSNTNRILRPDTPEFYRSEAVGLKTGSTTPAGGCLLSAFRVEGGYIIIGVFGCPDRPSRFTDTNALFDYHMEFQ